jgi:hypothetical protein
MMTNGRITTSVRVNITLPANVHFPEEGSTVEDVRLVDTNDLQVTLRRHASLEGDLLERVRQKERGHENDSEYKALVSRLKRTLVIPQVEIVLKKQSFKSEELGVRDRKIVIRGDDPTQSGWFQVTREAVTTYNALVNQLFTIFPDQPWGRLETIRIGLSDSSLYAVNFPWCLMSWEAEFKEVSRGEWVGDLWFELEKEPSDPRYLGVASINIGSQQLQTVAKGLESLTVSKESLPIAWEYLYLASRNLDGGNVRSAVIDIDIAVDYLAKRYIQLRVNIGKVVIDRIFKKSSTGDLLAIAQVLSPSDAEAAVWGTLEKLHNLRNNALHGYQRRFGPRELELVESARHDIFSLLRGLSSGPVAKGQQRI